MPVRLVIIAAGLFATGTALAEPMNAEAARRFVVGKTFAYSCFDGTRGTGKIYNDGSVVGTIQTGAGGPLRSAAMPPGTLRVKGDTVCASVRGMPFEPCFNLNKTDEHSFRGSVSGLGFAYCDFTRRTSPPAIRTSWRLRPTSQPLKLDAPTAESGQTTTQAAAPQAAAPAAPQAAE